MKNNIRIVPLMNIIKEFSENRFLCETTDDKNYDTDILILDSILSNKVLPVIMFDGDKDKKSVIKGGYILMCIKRCLFSEATEYFFDIINNKIIHLNKDDDKTLVPLNIFTDTLRYTNYKRKYLKHIDEYDKCFDNVDCIGRNIYNFNLIVIDNSTIENSINYSTISKLLNQ